MQVPILFIKGNEIESWIAYAKSGAFGQLIMNETCDSNIFTILQRA